MRATKGTTVQLSAITQRLQSNPSCVWAQNAFLSLYLCSIILRSSRCPANLYTLDNIIRFSLVTRPFSNLTNGARPRTNKRRQKQISQTKRISDSSGIAGLPLVTHTRCIKALSTAERFSLLATRPTCADYEVQLPLTTRLLSRLAPRLI